MTSGARTRARRTRRLLAITTLIVLAVGVGGAAAMMHTGQGSAVPKASAIAKANPSADLDQCANGTTAPGTTCDWVNGNVNESKAIYKEGDSLPYRLRFDNLSLSSHTVTIEWDTTKSGKHALDYLTTFNRTVTGANACDGVTGCSASTTFAIPTDAQVTGAGVTPVAGNFRLYGGTITAVSAYSYPNGTGFAGDMSARLTLTFTAGVANPVLTWAGHIATRVDWGMDNAAVSIPGSPYHTRLIDLDGSGGNQDRSLSASAVIFPGSITVIKQATPEGSWSFPFTASPSPLTSFSLVDDGTSANTKTFSDITTFQTYSVAETVPSGWTLDSISCSVTSANGGSASTSAPSVSISMQEGENWTCTFNDTAQPAHLIVIKHVVNDNGGTKAASDFTMTVTGGSPSPASFAGAESPGTNVTLGAGSYSVGESSVSGYTASYSADCTGTLSPGETKTCTVTNDDQAAHLIVVKHVVNDNGGTKAASDFTLTINGVTASGGSSFAGAESPGVDKTLTSVGSYTVTEGSVWGYTASYSADCTGSIALGQTKTCTVTNDDQPGTIVVKKVSKPVNTGSFDFSTTGTGYAGFTLPGGGQNSQTLDAGAYSVTESTQLGWLLTGIGGSTAPSTPYDCVVTGSGGSTGVGDLATQTAAITLKNGDTVTCTFENTGQGVTRTQGFWATHPQLAQIAWFGGTAFGHTFPGVANVTGIGNGTLCSKSIDTLGKLMGGFWSNIAKKSTGVKRSSLDQARMQLLQQLLAAELNASAFGAVPSGGTAAFGAWESAFCGTSGSAISTALQQSASFNTSGDSGTFTPGTSADANAAKSGANLAFWDNLP